MIISVVNLTSLDDVEVQAGVRAVNRQISQDFAPHWGFSATLRLEGRIGKRPKTQSLADMRGEAVLYIWDGVDPDDALGYHDANFKGIPFGIVFRDLSSKLDESWTATFSHEALELLGEDERAAQRMRIKGAAKLARRAMRYKTFTGNRTANPRRR